jgi:hypothetical protein
MSKIEQVIDMSTGTSPKKKEEEVACGLTLGMA